MICPKCGRKSPGERCPYCSPPITAPRPAADSAATANISSTTTAPSPAISDTSTADSSVAPAVANGSAAAAPGISGATVSMDTPKPTPRSAFVDDQIQTLLRNAHIFLRRNMVDLAREAVAEVLQLDATDVNAHEILGELLEAEGNDIGAYKEYKLACPWPDACPEAEVRLARLSLRLPPETISLLQPNRPHLEGALPADLESQLPAEARAILAAAAMVRPAPKHAGGAVSSLASLAVPGLGQLIQAEYTKAGAMFGVWLICCVYLLTLLSSSRTNPTNDPAFWGVVVVLGLDYLCSITDTRVSSSGQIG